MRGNESSTSEYNAVPTTDTENDNNDVIASSNKTSLGMVAQSAHAKASMPKLTKEDLEIFELVKSGNVTAVEGAIGKINDINIINRAGYSLLHVAVVRQDEAMVSFLLTQSGIELYDTLFHAIRKKNLTITNLLLEAHDKVTPFSPGHCKDVLCKSVTINIPPNFDSEFSLEVVTPLMLAAQEGSPELLEVFYKREERLELDADGNQPARTHNPDCSCRICKKSPDEDDFTQMQKKYQLFEAITKPEYMCFIAKEEGIDPVNYALDKIVQLETLKERDVAYGATYDELIANLEEFLSDMVGQCRSTGEAEIFLAQKPSSGIKKQLPLTHTRLWYAMRLNLKTFVSEPNVQAVISNAWVTRNWDEWYTYGLCYRAFNVVIRVVTWPCIPFFVCWCPQPDSSNVDGCSIMNRKLRAPFNRFLTHVGSYIIFLGLVVIQMLFPYQRCNSWGWRRDWVFWRVPDPSCKERGPPNIGTELFIMAYLVGFYISIIKRQSIAMQWFWKCKWNLCELIGLFTLTAVGGCWAAALYWKLQPENQAEVNLFPTVWWPQDCAEIFGDCFIGVAALFGAAKVIRFTLVFEDLGPIQVGLARQIQGFVSGCLIYSLVLIGFGSGLLALYVPYKGLEGYVAPDNNKTMKVETFTNFFTTLSSLFWYLHGAGGGLTDTKLPHFALGSDHHDSMNVGNSDQKSSTGSPALNFTITNHHYVTEYTGMGLYCCFHVIVQLMTVSMLTAYFSQILKKMDKDLEWKYAKTELYLSFINDTVMPPPINILSWMPIVINWVYRLICKSKKEIEKDPEEGTKATSCDNTTTREMELYEKNRKMYDGLIKQLMYRYREFKAEADKETYSTKEDVAGLEEELSAIKSLLKNKQGGRGDEGPGSATPAQSKNQWQTIKNVMSFGVPSKSREKRDQNPSRGSPGKSPKSTSAQPSAAPVAKSMTRSATSALFSERRVPTQVMPPPPSRSASQPVKTISTPPELPNPIKETTTDTETTD